MDSCRVIADQLGHADSSTTARTYSHVAPLPDGYCPDCCGAPCIRTWLPKVCPACGNDRSHDWTVGDDSYACDLAPQTTADAVGVLDGVVTERN